MSAEIQDLAVRYGAAWAEHDRDAIMAVRAATSKRVTAAGGITTQQEIDELGALGIDAVVGMAIYTGKLETG